MLHAILVLPRVARRQTYPAEMTDTESQEAEDNAWVPMAFLFPLWSFIGGARMLGRRPWHGLGVMAVSVVIAGIYAAVVTYVIDRANGPGELDSSLVESQIDAWAQQQSGPHAKIDIACPDSMPIEVGAQYTCAASDQKGRSIDIIVTVENEDGGVTWVAAAP
jgi:hypothetical protein